jgi:hypothetical protein
MEKYSKQLVAAKSPDLSNALSDDMSSGLPDFKKLVMG